MPLEGFGIINPPPKTEADVISYPPEKTIIYEIKADGKLSEQIHFLFFSRMNTGAVNFPIKLSEALDYYNRNETFKSWSVMKQKKYLLPFKTMDLMEVELKNLDISNTSDTLSNTLKIVRRNQSIQKDFFSMAEYLIYAVNTQIELAYYKRLRNLSHHRRITFID